MTRYIDADKVHEAIETLQTQLESNDDKVWRKNRPFYKGLAMARGVINDTPTADVAPRSEVAREIFEELEDILKIVKIPCIKADGRITPLTASYWAIDPNDYAKLKKKYTEGQE